MVHNKRRWLALLLLLGAVPVMRAQEPLPTPPVSATAGAPVGGYAGVPPAVPGRYAPGAGPYAPGAWPYNPGAGQYAPGAGSYAPGGGPGMPGAGSFVPGAGPLAAGPIPPGAGPMTPGAGPTPNDALFNYYSNPGQLPAPGKLPPDPYGPQRFQMPTPSLNTDYAGGKATNLRTQPDEDTLGIRLDTSYSYFREFEVGTYLSEHQSLGAVGLTVIPFQAPCWLVGLRSAVVYNGNNSIAPDMVGASSDFFFSTRYKHMFLKFGYFLDITGRHRVNGFENSALINLPIIGNLTFDGAYGFGSGRDEFLEPRDPVFNQLRRVQVARNDIQLRIGHFFSPYFQAGLSNSFTNFQDAPDEYSAGFFANWFVGRMRISTDLTGGRGGLRGFVNLGFNWGGGANIDKHPIDASYDFPIDAVSWATIATRRDPTIKLRDAGNGMPPPQNVPLLLP